MGLLLSLCDDLNLNISAGLFKFAGPHKGDKQANQSS